ERDPGFSSPSHVVFISKRHPLVDAELNSHRWRYGLDAFEEVTSQRVFYGSCLIFTGCCWCCTYDITQLLFCKVDGLCTFPCPVIRPVIEHLDANLIRDVVLTHLTFGGVISYLL